MASAMRALLLSAVLLLAPLSLAPAAATGTCQAVVAAIVCAGDWGYYDGCPEPWSFSSAQTGVALYSGVARVFAGGADSCRHVCVTECYFLEGHGVFVTVEAFLVGSAVVGWTEGPRCMTYVATWTASGPRTVNLGCPAGGAPALPWGHVLP